MLPINPSQIPKIYADALKLQNAGKLQDAVKQYSIILQANPRIAEVHYQLGRLFLGADQPGKAVDHLRIAADLKPAEPAIWAAYGDAVAELSEDAETTRCLTRAKAAGLPPQIMTQLQDKLNPRKAKSKAAIGTASRKEIEALVALMNTGKFDKAEAMALSLHNKHPKVALIADILANAQVRLGKTDDARASFQKAIALDPTYAEAHNNYGRLLLELGEVDDALRETRTALRLLPGLALAHHNLGAILARKGEHSEAVKRFRKADQLRPGSAETLRMMGNALSRVKEYFEAEKTLRAAVEIDPDNAESHVLLGQAQAAIGQEERAKESFQKALSLAPNSSAVNHRMALYLQTMGDFDAAEAYFRKAIELDPENGENYRVMVASYKLTMDDPLIQQMIDRFNDPETTISNRRQLGFALSKVMEDNKRYDEVFKYLHTANALMREEFPYDIASRENEVSAVMSFFEKIDLPSQSIEGATDFAPIFVTGMPRSGTTLVEQIISSHSQVSGAGEVGFAARAAQTLIFNARAQGKSFGDLPPTEIANLGRDYEAYMRQNFPDAPRITDKSIQTYTFMGLIKLALPRSRMIVVRRDPRDNLLSIYRNMFVEGTHLYSYNLSDLGTYYKLFVRLLEFWQERIPDWFHIVEYEDLVANTEAESRKLIAACGLDWEDQCLAFHKNSRRVDTLSVYQVRQPIYASSLKAWQRYEEELGELFEALE